MRSEDEVLPVLGVLPSTWRIASFGSVLLGGTRNGIYKPKQHHGSGAKIVNMGELFAHRRLHSVAMNRLQITANELERFGLRHGDLLFARRSLVAAGAGKCSLVCAVDEPTVFESSIIRARPNPGIADSAFLFYLFSSPYGKHALGTITRTVAVSGITGRDLTELPIPLPPLAEQHRIADTLGALDDKIELNHRMNRTLESIARAIFKSWFVDFDPVRKKMEGKEGGEGGLPSALAAHFPSGFDAIDGRRIPTGWRFASLGTLFPRGDCVLTGPFGSKLHSSDYREHGVPIVLVKHVLDGRFVDDGMPLVGLHKLDELTRYRLRLGDIVFTRVGAVGRSALVHVRQDGWLFSGQTLRVRVPDPHLLQPEYLAWVFLDPAFVGLVEGSAVGSTRASLNTELLRGFQFVLPSPAVQAAFATVAHALGTLREQLDEETRGLRRVRDCLLPILVSGRPFGEKCLPDADGGCEPRVSSA